MVEKAEDTIYQRLYISVERLTRLFEYGGHCRIKSNKGSGGPQGIRREYRYSTRGRRMQGDQIIETTD